MHHQQKSRIKLTYHMIHTLIITYLSFLATTLLKFSARIFTTYLFLFPAILLYRICRCCRRIYVKLLHTVFHALAIPCVAVGFLAVLDSHNLASPRPIPNFYSLHSWIGLVTMGLFAIQVKGN